MWILAPKGDYLINLDEVEYVRLGEDDVYIRFRGEALTFDLTDEWKELLHTLPERLVKRDK